MLAADLDSASCFGRRGNGITRIGWSPELAAALEWFRERLTEAGLEVETDAAGNVIGEWRCGSGKAVLVGSHLDTVPEGGRFDGALGVLGGLAAVELLQANGFEPARPIWIASFMDEEGARFGVSMIGSRAFVGDDLGWLAERGAVDGTPAREALATAGFDLDAFPGARRVDEVGAYLELHVEQGPVLERAGIDVGIVASVVGLLQFRARMRGQANHAGTTPMELRRDAFVGAARAAVELRDAARARRDMTANVGWLRVHPDAANVVAGECEFSVDARAAEEQTFEKLDELVRSTLERIAAEERLEWELEVGDRDPPVEFHPDLLAILEQAARLEGASSMQMASGAGHDAMVLARHIPAAMLFVPSRGGISHSPDEYTSPEQCELGVSVLARALALLSDAL
jgi:allantoate deiminase